MCDLWGCEGAPGNHQLREAGTAVEECVTNADARHRVCRMCELESRAAVSSSIDERVGCAHMSSTVIPSASECATPADTRPMPRTVGRRPAATSRQSASSTRDSDWDSDRDTDWDTDRDWDWDSDTDRDGDRGWG
eukprot:CAMPEP_0173174474 /NCGR_PEP_ID=MMETSP1141-20130122/3372_1 /TAXON_ID=483371 /ORGANISM="non described non described, Strain CCMP2298" /LENGTH=134 /DNA_ID=CAMNT_0014096601 /DNA_START=27 /DNA_END=432 /DNA_ORIENTATION=-